MLVVVISLVESDGIRSLYMLPIYPIYSLPHGPGERLTALGANVAPNGGRHPASGACLLGKAQACSTGLSPSRAPPQGTSGRLGGYPGIFAFPGPLLGAGVGVAFFHVSLMWQGAAAVRTTPT